MNVALTQDDIDDLIEGHGINALAADGSEVIVHGDLLEGGDLSIITAGGEVTRLVRGVEVTFTAE